MQAIEKTGNPASTDEEKKADTVTYVTAPVVPGVFLEKPPSVADSIAVSEIGYVLGRGFRRVGDYYVVARICTDYPQSHSEPKAFVSNLCAQINARFGDSYVPVPCIGLIECKETTERIRAEIVPVPFEAPHKELARTLLTGIRLCLGVDHRAVTRIEYILEYMGSRHVQFDMMNALEARYKYDMYFSEYWFARAGLRDLRALFQETYDDWYLYYLTVYGTPNKPATALEAPEKKSVDFPCPSLPIYCFVVRHLLLNPRSWRTDAGKLLSRTVEALFKTHKDTREAWELATKAINEKFEWYRNNPDPSDDMCYNTDAVGIVLAHARELKKPALSPEDIEELELVKTEMEILLDARCDQCEKETEKPKDEKIMTMVFNHLQSEHRWCLVCAMENFDRVVHERIDEARQKYASPPPPLPPFHPVSDTNLPALRGDEDKKEQ
jgi:hypothetical protein